MTKRLEVSELAYDEFVKYANGEPHSRALRRLAKNANTELDEKSSRVALIILEDLWWDLDANPSQASSAPFFEGIERLCENIKSYRFNFYDSSSFSKALERALTVSEERIVLYVAAHGTQKKVGGASGMTLLSKIREQGINDKRLEGVIVSSCTFGGNDEAIAKLFEGRINWFYGYRTSVDWLGSLLLETALLECLAYKDHSYIESEEGIGDLFSEATRPFDLNWEMGEDNTGRKELKDSLVVAVRPKNGKRFRFMAPSDFVKRSKA
ncbi:hypothetical protein OPU71_16900 [Niveibacterium sp. 24ML]|uniref:hypothetical protein n=1 Tax=Niveibacterium sp. 24ML TaxID=2985512 RepID=UPI00226F1E38|nr:hypothetical protein [Niveibacterium sp. 24ML]MCX9157804.1 hypothetical protein [Niveibacterium sp. 24ML]